MRDEEWTEALLDGIPVESIRAAYGAAPGNEIESGKFASPESSAALTANTFGFFLDRCADLPSLPGTEDAGWPARTIRLEGIVRFPWAGGRHPCLDALIETSNALIGVESKRYEPFRSSPKGDLSPAYWRPVWGEAMTGYEQVRDGVADGSLVFEHLDAIQLLKHAFALRTAVHREGPAVGKQAVLYYLYAEPREWPDGRAIPAADVERHRSEVGEFARRVADDEVTFRSCTHSQLLEQWSVSENPRIRELAKAIAARFGL